MEEKRRTFEGILGEGTTEVVAWILSEFTGKWIHSDIRAGHGRGGARYWEDALEKECENVRAVYKASVQQGKEITRLRKELELCNHKEAIWKHKEEIARLTEELGND